MTANMSMTANPAMTSNILQDDSPTFLTTDEIFGREISTGAFIGLPHSELLYSNPYYFKGQSANELLFNVRFVDSVTLSNHIEPLIDWICFNGNYSKIYCGRCIWELHGIPKIKYSDSEEEATAASTNHMLSYQSLYKIVIEEYRESEEQEMKHYCIKVTQNGYETDVSEIYKYFHNYF